MTTLRRAIHSHARRRLRGFSALDRYAARCVNLVLVVTRIAVLGARSAPGDTGNQARALPGYRGQSPWLVPLFRGLLAVILVPTVLQAQVLYGSLTGTVTDASDAPMPGATVVALNVGTGVAKEAITDERGDYSFTDLQPGVYKVTFSLQAFASLAQDNVGIEANRVRRLDARLDPAAVTETVVVLAGDPGLALQTERGDVNVIQSARQVNNLPLSGSTGRNYQSLMAQVPGAVMAGEQNSAAGNPRRSISFNVNGVSRLQNNTKVDGASIQYPWLPTNTAYVPPAESIEAVNIVTNSFDAEQGIAGGAAINVTLKSGTNVLHGTAWEYHTNSKFRARNYFQTTPNNPKDVLDQFGGNVGGPIRRNKIFFFADWERSRQRQASPIRTYSLAPADLRNGDFSATGVTIYDPASNPDPRLRTPFPGNMIPQDRIDPAAVELIQRMPLPSAPGYINNYTAFGDYEFNRDNIDFKVNVNATERLSLNGAYSISPTNIFDPPALGEVGGDALAGGQLGFAPGRVQVARIGGTYTISPTMLFDGNVGYTRQRLGAENVDIDSNFGLDVLNIPGTNGPDRLQGGIPAFFVGGWANLGNPNTGNPFLFRDNQYVATANLTWVRASHSVRFGWDYQNQQINHFQPQGGTFNTARGSFGFNGNMTRLQDGPAPADTRFNSWADFLLGLPNNAGKVVQLVNPNSVYMQTHALYARDQWRVSRRLTLSYGLRWERYLWPTRDNYGVSRFDPSDGNVYIGGLGGVPMDTGADVGPGQFLPRAGAAYQLTERTVVRAGYGMSSDPKPFIDFRNAYPTNFVWNHPAATFNGATNAFLPVTTLRQGLDEAKYGVLPDISQGVIPLPTGAGTTTWPKEVERMYIQSWNLTVQHQITSALTGQIGYVGTRIKGQMGFININASAPGTGNAGRPLAPLGIVSDINSIQPFGDAFYDALQAQLTGRWGGSQYGMAYTWSKAINYQDNDGNPRIPWLGAKERNRGLANYDRTHNFQAYWVLESPFGPGQKWLTDGVAGALLGDWQLNGVLSVMSGTPIFITQGNAGNLNAGGSGQYPDQVLPDVEILGGAGLGNPYFDRAAFAPVNIPTGQPQRFGDAGRNAIRGPGFFMVDLGLFRTIRFGRYNMQFRAEAFNLLNHPNFGNPGGDISNGNSFGYITATTGQGHRQLRFGMRFAF
jgi:Carboxypeptidase regulatory-like domain/TonB dependent receptor